MKKSVLQEGTIKRFGAARMWEHHLFAFIFIVLVTTGLSQRFHDASWASSVVMSLGGIDNLRMLHRYSGLAFAVMLMQHVIIGCHGIIFRHWLPSMIINKQDFVHAVENLKFYFGLSNHAARCDRYDYKQKFEYWGVLLGGVIMFCTGLILWFPTLVFKLLPFLPGQLIPAARVAHSNESMLAFLVIVSWHIYNAVFSPEVFPLDTAIFTGKISRERMMHEHPLELERLEADNKTEEASQI